MQGVFVVNKKGRPAFLPLPDQATVLGIRYQSAERLVFIADTSGQEELLGIEVQAPLHEALLLCNEVLIVDIADDGSAVREYTVLTSKI